MVVFLPEPDRFDEFEESLDAGQVKAIIDSLSMTYLRLSVPKFKYEWGMKDAFNSDADFSGIDGTRALVISEVIHKAFVSVNEAGTEAAACNCCNP